MALWLHEGTVSVTNGSQALVGVGTKFKTNVPPAAPGQEIVIFGADGHGIPCEILAVPDDTHITLALPFRGATGTGLSFLVKATEIGSMSDLALRAAQVMSKIAGIAWEADRSFLPTITGTTGNGTVTYTRQNGRVETIGTAKLVTVDMVCHVTGMTGDIQIAGLPFTVGDIDGHFPIVAKGFKPGNSMYITAAASKGTNHLALEKVNMLTGGNENLHANDMAADGNLVIGFSAFIRGA